MNALQPTDRVDRLINNGRIIDYISKNDAQVRRRLKRQAEQAAEYLVKAHSRASDEILVTALEHLLPRLQVEKVDVFFSYKAKDRSTAIQIAKKLQRWSAGSLNIRHMDEIDIKGVGQRWREQIEKIIPQCDWFLLLLPSPGDERDWVLFEAGYFFRGQGLTGRMVCLHHPDNEVADALGAHQSVPAELDKVRAFLEGLFHKENWIPGMPPLNPDLNELDSKAKEIVNLIKPPLQYVRFCCGPHMAVAFDDASTVRGWEQLASGRVIDSNEECKQLFGLAITRASFGDWFQDISGGEQGNELRMELAHAVQAIGEGRQVPAIRASFCAASGQLVRPRICAVRRHKISQRVEAIDILFDDVMPPVTTGMRPELAALTITLDLAMRFRYQLLEKYANRKLEREDVLAFHQASTLFYLQAVQEKLISEDPLVIREKVLKLFVGEDKTIIQKMYERSDQLWRLDGKGELDQAITKIDPEALASFVKELFDMNQHFLTVTSKRFVELIVNSELCSKVVAGERR